MKIVSTVVIKQPVEKVWAYFIDPENMKQWIQGFKEYQLVEGQPGVAGSRACHIYDAHGVEMRLDEEVLVAEPLKRYVGLLSHAMMNSSYETCFESLSADTSRMTCTVKTEFNSKVMNLFGMLMTRMMQTRQDKSLQCIKTILEENPEELVKQQL